MMMYNFTNRWFARVRSDNKENLNDWPVKTHYMPFISEPDLEFMCGSHDVPDWYAAPQEKQRLQKKRDLMNNKRRMAKARTDTQIADFEARQLSKKETTYEKY